MTTISPRGPKSTPLLPSPSFHFQRWGGHGRCLLNTPLAYIANSVPASPCLWLWFYFVLYRYECKDNKCDSDSSCFTRTETLGCDAFCVYDANGDGVVSRDEMIIAFLYCTDGDRGWCQSTLSISIHHNYHLFGEFFVAISFFIVCEHIISR